MDEHLEETLKIQQLTLEETKVPLDDREAHLSYDQSTSCVNENPLDTSFIPSVESIFLPQTQDINYSEPIILLSQKPNSLETRENLEKNIKKRSNVVDRQCPNYDNYHIYEESSKAWYCILNCCNIMENNNKFYIIQLLEAEDAPGKFYLWKRWGRVGSIGIYAFTGPFGDVEIAKNEYLKKFNDKIRYGYIEIQIS